MSKKGEEAAAPEEETPEEETPEEEPQTGEPAEPMEQGGYEQTSTVGAQLAAMFPTRGGFESNEATESTQGTLPESWTGTAQGPRDPNRGGEQTAGPYGGIMAGVENAGPYGGIMAGVENRPEVTGGEATRSATGEATGEEGPVDPETGEPLQMATPEPILAREPVPNALGLPSFYQPMTYTGGM
jgi:hypothetical protein